MELYQPPLVDTNAVDKVNTLYMRMQTGLVEMEYDVNRKTDNLILILIILS